MTTETAIILINIGTPDAPNISSVRKYLTAFLNDKQVIDLPWLARKILVNCIIVPFRTPKSTKLYQKLWTKNGSPLLLYGNSLQEKLQQKVKENADVFFAMRYGNPSIKSALQNIKQAGYKKVIIVPLFPQYATSTTQTIIDEVQKQAKKIGVNSAIKFIPQFYNNEGFLNAFVKRIQDADYKNFEHIIFSFHGLPERHIQKIHAEKYRNGCSCENENAEFGEFCYKATCYETARLLAQKLDLQKQDFSVSFQSRLTKKWLNPFTDELILQKAKSGTKKILIVAPSFVADCLETTIEIGIEYKELFLENCGEELKLTESLNSSNSWVNALYKIVSQTSN